VLDFLRGKASERKLRPFAAAWCRRVRHQLAGASGREAVDAGEMHEWIARLHDS